MAGTDADSVRQEAERLVATALGGFRVASDANLATGRIGLLWAAAGMARAGNGKVWREATHTGHDSWPAPERAAPVTAEEADTGLRPDHAVPPADAAGSARVVSQPPAPPEPAGTDPDAPTAARRPVPASPASRVTRATDDDPGRRD